VRKFFKVLLPPLIGFAIYFAAIRYSPEYFNLRIGEIGQGDIVGFMSYYRYALPLLFVIALLTQLLIVVPIWEGLSYSPAAYKATIVIDLFFICLLFALMISYPISDLQADIHHFFELLGFMTLVQVLYWLINSLILHLLDDKANPKKTD
jgi:hypothetical protein